MAKRPIIVAMDLEGVLVPEVWISFAEKTGIPALRLTTRDVANYDELMKHRIKILKENGLKLQDIQAVINTMEPLPGAVEYMAWLRERYQGVILSDTFYEFASPLMRKLNWPTLFCNSLVTDANGSVIDYKQRLLDGKRHAVLAFKQLNFDVVAMGDSYNDTAMLAEASVGILFRPSENVKREFPQFPVAVEYETVKKVITDFAAK
ncbi:MAG: bifunctional phosphoserine phosphatase/homoserine phosphotransferase ThrH [Lentisphaeria bacterium]|nr:bifunctional phosphoserine phosphatase/homoserine phosphotransferase ThrH [Victivallales bacterium]MCR4574936.1 bifunctional phosphoserine phosphatase/homoserine phosphotransferase ThrH [Lentisphaeria bacterium]